MYIPAIYKHEDWSQISDFIAAHSFATLVSQTNGTAAHQLWATHLPLLLRKNERGEDVLLGHISRANPQWHNFKTGEELLAIFTGAQHYISSSWYDHQNVPTWNYLAVHAYATVRLIDNAELLESLKDLVNTYEATSATPVRIEEMPAEMVAREMRGIVGFELRITDVSCAYKLSQNRDEANHTAIIKELEQLETPDATGIAFAMHTERYEKDRKAPEKGTF